VHVPKYKLKDSGDKMETNRLVTTHGATAPRSAETDGIRGVDGIGAVVFIILTNSIFYAVS
jgi:hypothetical protein